MGKKIIVGVSGGVDSTVSLILLKKQGFSPIAVSLKLPYFKDKENCQKENACCTAKSLKIAKSICQKLNIPFYINDVQKDFRKKVVAYFTTELKNNRTPNPCVICNRYLKFSSLLEFGRKLGIKYVATGHYARIKKNKIYQLLQAKDKNKDQTYNLCFLTQKQLKHIFFPLGNYYKSQVYQIAKKNRLDFFLKQKQSQDFCFASNKALDNFIKAKVKPLPGKITNNKGDVLGQHQGLAFYTIGQRKKINLSKGPWFVKGFNRKKNILIVTRNKKEVSQKELFLYPFNFISISAPLQPIKVMAKIRSRQPTSPAILNKEKDGRLKLTFKQPQFAVTPGQFAVFYQNNVCLGGGKII